MSSTLRVTRPAVMLAALIGALLLAEMVRCSPDMFTALVDMERALIDEESASQLLKRYVCTERQRLQDLEQYVM